MKTPLQESTNHFQPKNARGKNSIHRSGSTSTVLNTSRLANSSRSINTPILVDKSKLNTPRALHTSKRANIPRSATRVHARPSAKTPSRTPTTKTPISKPISSTKAATNSPYTASPKHNFLHNSNLNKLKAPAISLDQFDIGKMLGKGKLGTVYCAIHKPSGYLCALKVMDLQELENHSLIANLKREVEIQTSLDHKNILKCFNYFITEEHVVLILDFCIGGELYEKLSANKRLNEKIASYYIYQTTLALQHLHSKRIMHRDIKPENILVDDNDNIKLADFGWSIKLEANQSRRLTMCGTTDYLSPELVNSSAYDLKTDIWSLGVLIYELLVGAPPFEHPDRTVTFKRISKVDCHFPRFVSADAKDLILKILKYNPKDRYTIPQILKHPWLTRNKVYWPKHA